MTDFIGFCIDGFHLTRRFKFEFGGSETLLSSSATNRRSLSALATRIWLGRCRATSLQSQKAHLHLGLYAYCLTQTKAYEENHSFLLFDRIVNEKITWRVLEGV